eukprot:4218426-Amphidinium_carterae.1
MCGNDCALCWCFRAFHFEVPTYTTTIYPKRSTTTRPLPMTMLAMQRSARQWFKLQYRHPEERISPLCAALAHEERVSFVLSIDNSTICAAVVKDPQQQTCLNMAK